MKVLACDIGSTNLKLQIFAFDHNGLPYPVGRARLIHHSQSWLNANRPLEALSSWLSEIAELILKDYGSKINAVGFTTFLEALIGLSPSNQIVFAGTNIRPTPIGTLEDATLITTFAGWMCWRLTGRCHLTAGQRAAGEIYAARFSRFKPRWAPLVMPGKKMQAKRSTPFGVYLGGTDEQLGYVGAGLFDSHGPQLVIATGTFWSVSCIAAEVVRRGIRRTEGSPPFLSVDSCVFYKWGPMIQALAQGSDDGSNDDSVPTHFFGHAASLWFSDGESPVVTRQAAVEDLKMACALLAPKNSVRAIVHGGGVRLQYARDLIHEACGNAELTFMDGDATLRGCAIVGREVHNAN